MLEPEGRRDEKVMMLLPCCRGGAPAGEDQAGQGGVTEPLSRGAGTCRPTACSHPWLGARAGRGLRGVLRVGLTALGRLTWSPPCPYTAAAFRPDVAASPKWFRGSENPAEAEARLELCSTLAVLFLGVWRRS